MMNDIEQEITKLWKAGEHYEAGMAVKDYLEQHSRSGFAQALTKAGMTTREEIMDELTADIGRLKQAQASGEDLTTSLLDPLSDISLNEAYRRLHELNHNDYAIYKVNGMNHQYEGSPANKDDLLDLIK